MGFDLIGTEPNGDKGKYFRNTAWFWHPLWKYVVTVVDVLSEEQISSGQLNDGVLIYSIQAHKIAEKLKEELESGRTAQYVDDYKKKMEALPNENCYACNGTGIFKFEEKIHTCSTCGGKQKCRPSVTYYPFTVENVCNFQEFCDHCGGFSIW